MEEERTWAKERATMGTFALDEEQRRIFTLSLKLLPMYPRLSAIRCEKIERSIALN